MAVDWDTLIEERNVWVEHNFPDRHIPDPGESIQGCIEELGELTHAVLKRAQSIRGTADEHIENARDAVGDLSVYLLGVMSHAQVTPTGEHTQVLMGTDPHGTVFKILTHVAHLGNIYEVEVETGQDLNNLYDQAVDLLVFQLREFCRVESLGDYDTIVREVWDSVKQRDWIKYPTNGRTS